MSIKLGENAGEGCTHQQQTIKWQTERERKGGNDKEKEKHSKKKVGNHLVTGETSKASA